MAYQAVEIDRRAVRLSEHAAVRAATASMADDGAVRHATRA